MDWGTIVKLIAEVGLPAAQYIIGQWQNNGEVTPETWVKAMELASQTALDRAKAVVAAAGLDQNDPHVKAVTEMVGQASEQAPENPPLNPESAPSAPASGPAQ